MQNSLEQLKYPIGRYDQPETIEQNYIASCIQIIKDFPKKLKKEVEGLTDIQLDTKYRDNGWTIRQVVNHCADSHIHSFIRFKLALTENQPTIKPYDETLWAELSDSKNISIEPALKMLEGTHERWVALLESMSEDDYGRTFIHPENNEVISLGQNIGIYAWHCRHHLAHILLAKESF